MASPEQRPRKRRTINACANCRSSKVRCDGKQPCQRCDRNDAACLYYAAAKDENTIRIERLESEVARLRDEMEHFEAAPQVVVASVTPGQCSEQRSTCSAVEAGLLTWGQAASWFHSFFSGSQFLVPIFCSKYDTVASVSSRSSFLFDAIVSIGCRADEGFDSHIYRQLQARLREHLTSVLINSSNPSVEDVQAITIMAAYSENSFVMIALALRFAVQLGLPDAIDQLMTRSQTQLGSNDAEVARLYRSTRLWYGVCNFDLFFSLDGGKMPSMTLHTSPRRIRSLLNHPERTAVDVRLLSQIELNTIRSEAYSRLSSNATDTLLAQNEPRLRTVLDNTTVELTLWLQEWTAIVSQEPMPEQRAHALQNLHIQQQWALMTLHLKAIAATGIENIALMTDFQRNSVEKAKDAATKHLHYILETSASPYSSPSVAAQVTSSMYLSTFRWTLDYVWAKCAFSVLLVLKLAILLQDPVPSVMLLLRDAHRLLEELKQVTVGHIAYFQILQTSVEKCEAALRESLAQQQNNPGLELTSPDTTRSAEDEFQGYVPSEFVFEWDFPGLNLKHMPLGWQDYFINIDDMF